MTNEDSFSANEKRCFAQLQLWMCRLSEVKKQQFMVNCHPISYIETKFCDSFYTQIEYHHLQPSAQSVFREVSFFPVLAFARRLFFKCVQIAKSHDRRILKYELSLARLYSVYSSERSPGVARTVYERTFHLANLLNVAFSLIHSPLAPLLESIHTQVK